MEQILIVEDDKKLSHLMAEYLQNHGYLVDTEERGDRAIYRILQGSYFLVILDLNLPALNGLQVCEFVRTQYKGFILMLTACEEDNKQIKGLNVGADDYIIKPVQPTVLLARIKALSRRKPLTSSQEKLIFGKLEIDLIQRIVKLSNQIIELKPSEFDLLVLLALNPGVCLSRNNIMQALRGIDYNGVDRIIDLRISYLRTKLEDNIDTPFRIQTIRGKGYIFQPKAWD